jgi:CRISPR-associated protein Csb1
MNSASAPSLTFDELGAAVVGSAAAFRLRLRLEPAGGPGDKVFPPTYEGGAYAREDRWIDNGRVPCVLLDSVPSQANRMELALQDAWERGQIDLPVISTDLQAAEHPGLRKITSLQAPHRIADAILRDSLLGKVKFRASPIGKKLDAVTLQNATPLFEHCPTALVFGMWDSTGPRGGLGVKFARALVSEIIGVNAVEGKKTSSRIDPLNIRVNAGVLYRTNDGGWTLDKNEAERDAKKNPVKLGKDGKPSEANHGNVKPTIADGGFTIESAEQVTVLSLPTLRRLRFPVKSDGKSDPTVDLAARTYLAALGLLGATLAVDAGYDLRSRCLLHAVEPVRWVLLGRPGEPEKVFTLTGEEAIELTRSALSTCDKVGLPFHREEVVLVPSPGLLTLVKKSIELAATEVGGES